MKTPILGSTYVARSVNAADNLMINLFPEIVPEGGKEAAFLQRAPGLRLRRQGLVGAWSYVGLGLMLVLGPWAMQQWGLPGWQWVVVGTLALAVLANLVLFGLAKRKRFV